jgi:hypothetical protein
MKTLNRSAAAVIPAQPFLDRLHHTSAHLSLNELRLEPTIHLCPEYDTEEERASICKGGARRFVKNSCMAGIALQQHGLLIGASKLSSRGLSTTSTPS